MLAKTYDANKTLLAYPVYVQPKLDGVRMLANVRKGVLTSLESRNGTDFDHLIPMFRADVERAYASSNIPDSVTALDGELYAHGVPFQTIVSWVRNKSNAAVNEASLRKLEYHVYDLVDATRTFDERYATLKAMPLCGKLVMVETTTANNKRDVDAYLKDAEARGYEGIMLRACSRNYEMGKRSASLHKYKRFNTDEFTVVGVREATGRDKGTPVFELSVGNATFSARPTGTLEERRDLYRRRRELIGQRVTVQYQGVSTNGIPRFPVALVVRDYE